MSTFDTVIWNTLERLLSSDLNAQSSMKDRVLADLLRYKQGANVWPSVAGSVPTFAPRNAVLGGLVASPSGSDVSVSAGALMQDSGTLAPVPTSIDSTYRLGVIRTPTVLPMPSPGADSWVLIEAQVVEVVTLNESRDIWTLPSGPFAPAAVDKRSERRVQFQQTTLVGAVPPFTGGDWVPIAVVFRPSGGGAVTAAAIYDVRPEIPVRPSFSSGLGLVQSTRSRFSASDLVTPSSVIQIEAECFSSAGHRLWYSGQLSPVAPFIESGYTSGANAIRYLYLAPFRDGLVRNVQGASGQGNCQVILSAIAPSPSTGRNASPITPGAPWGTVIAAGEAVCVAALKRDSVDAGWLASWRSGDTTRIQEPANAAALSPPASGDNAITVASFAPAFARAVLIQVEWFGGGTPGTTRFVALQETASGLSVTGFAKPVDDGGRAVLDFEIPAHMSGLALDLNVSGGAVNAGTVASIRVLGWRW